MGKVYVKYLELMLLVWVLMDNLIFDFCILVWMRIEKCIVILKVLYSYSL